MQTHTSLGIFRVANENVILIKFVHPFILNWMEKQLIGQISNKPAELINCLDCKLLSIVTNTSKKCVVPKTKISNQNRKLNMKVSDLQSTEYAPFYAKYIAQVGNDTLLETFENNTNNAIKLYESIPEDKHEYRYEEGKWSIKEVLQHIIDTERICAYRVLRIGRADTTPLQGFEQNGYNDAAKANRRSFASLLMEYKAVRQSTWILVESLDDDMLQTQGTVSGATVSARALAFMLLGHELHHIAVLKERYL